MNKKMNKKEIIGLIIIIVFLGGLIYLGSQQKPKISEESSVPEAKPSVPSTVRPEPPKIRYISGVIKEVKKNSIVITEAAGKDTEVGFDSSTNILKGEGTGETTSASDFAAGWNTAIFLPENEDNNIAQIIHLVSQK